VEASVPRLFLRCEDGELVPLDDETYGSEAELQDLVEK
jgi:hypothetical protein